MAKGDSAGKQPEGVRREAVEWYFANGMSASATAKRFGNVSRTTVLKWVRRYATAEQRAAFEAHVKPKYTEEFRAEVVDYYFANGENLLATAKHFSLPISTVAPWVKANRGERTVDSEQGTVDNEQGAVDSEQRTGGITHNSSLSPLTSLDDYTYDFILMVLRYHLTAMEDGGAGKDAAKTCEEFGLPMATFRFIERKYGFPGSLAELDEIDKTHIAVDRERKTGRYSERFRIHVFEYYFSPNCRCNANTAARFFGICTSTVRSWVAKYGYPKTIEELRITIQTKAEADADAQTRRLNETTDPYPIDFIVGTLKFYYEHGHNRKIVLARYGVGEQLLQTWIDRYGDYEALSQYRERQIAAEPHIRAEGHIGFTDEFVKQVLDYIFGPQTTNRITVDEAAAKFGISRDTVRKIIRDHGKEYAKGSIDRGAELESDTVAPRKRFQHYSWPIIFKVLKYYYRHDETMQSVAKHFGIDASRVGDWKRRYGERPEMEKYKAKAKRTWQRVRKYPEELKQAALKAYLEHPTKFGAISAVAKRFGISYPILNLWIKQAGVRR